MNLDDLRPEVERRLGRLRTRWVFLVQIGVAVFVAWLVASKVLGHATPFFAPVTAILCLGLTYGQRLRNRIVEVTVGVAIGVLVGDLIVTVLGAGPWQMAVVVVLAMAIAIVVSSGQLLVIQAGVQSVFIVALVVSQDAAVSRWLDALVGGAGRAGHRGRSPRPRRCGGPAPRPPAPCGASRPRCATSSTPCAAATGGLRPRPSTAPVRWRASWPSCARPRPRGWRSCASRRCCAGTARPPRPPPPSSSRSNGACATCGCSPGGPLVAVARQEAVPARYVDLVESLADAAEDLARVLDEHASRRPRAVLQRVAGLSARVDPTAGLSAEMIRGQVRSMVVDLLVVAGVDDDEALQMRARVPALTRALPCSAG